jgi:hypothetical protein
VTVQTSGNLRTSDLSSVRSTSSAVVQGTWGANEAPQILRKSCRQM